MAANTNPIYTLTPDIQWSPTALIAANTAKDGTGTVATVFTADATNGGFVQKIKFRAAGANGATVARIFINNGGVNTTATNNVLFDEITLAATSTNEAGAQPPYELPLNIALPPGYKILVTFGTAVTTGYYISVTGGKY